MEWNTMTGRRDRDRDRENRGSGGSEQAKGGGGKSLFDEKKKNSCSFFSLFLQKKKKTQGRALALWLAQLGIQWRSAAASRMPTATGDIREIVGQPVFVPLYRLFLTYGKVSFFCCCAFFCFRYSGGFFCDLVRRLSKRAKRGPKKSKGDRASGNHSERRQQKPRPRKGKRERQAREKPVFLSSHFLPPPSHHHP